MASYTPLPVARTINARFQLDATRGAHQLKSQPRGAGLRERPINATTSSFLQQISKKKPADESLPAQSEVKPPSDFEFYEVERQVYIDTLDDLRNNTVPKLQAQLTQAGKQLSQADDDKNRLMALKDEEIRQARAHASKLSAERDELLGALQGLRAELAQVQQARQAADEEVAGQRAENVRLVAAKTAAETALKARTLRDDLVQDSLDMAREETSRMRGELKEARERERIVEAASAQAVEQFKQQAQQAKQDLDTLAVQTQALLEGKRQAEDTILGLKAMLEREREKVSLQRDYLMRKRSSGDEDDL